MVSNYPPGVTGFEDYFWDGDTPKRKPAPKLSVCKKCGRKFKPSTVHNCKSAATREG